MNLVITMTTTFKQLCNCFSDKAINIFQNNEEEVFLQDVKNIRKNKLDFSKDIIYIGETSILNDGLKNITKANFILINDDHISIKDFFVNKLNIIELKDSEDIFQIYNQTRDFFQCDIEMERYAAALFQSYIINKGLSNIVQEASNMLNNPIVVIDLSYKILAYSNIKEVKDKLWIDNIKKGYCSYEFIVAVKKMRSVQAGMKSDEPYEVSSKKSPILKLISKVKIDNKHIANVILIQSKTMILQRDKDLLEITSKIIAEELKKNKFYRNSKKLIYEEFIYNLLEDKSQEVDVFREIIINQSLEFGKKLSVLVFDISKYNPYRNKFGHLRDVFSILFPNEKLVYYKDDIVIIYDKDKDINKITEEYISKVKEFLTVNKIYLGISREFSDILQCKKYYLQAVKAMNFSKTILNKNTFVFYSDIQIYDLILPIYSNMDYKDYCNPMLIKLKEYDNLKKTDMYNTLFIYLKNNENIEKTAEELYIHRNTARYRIHRIVDLTNIDFTNMEKITNIYLSYKFNKYVETIKAESIGD